MAFISSLVRVLFILLATSAVFSSTIASAQHIGVYAPGGTLSSAYFPSGSTHAVIDEVSWRSMSRYDFAAYDVLWIEANNCQQLSDIQRAARETQAVWGPAVDGRITFQSGDLDFHASHRDGRAREFVGRLINYLYAGGGTSLMLNTGCTARDGAVVARTVADWEPVVGVGLADGPVRNDYDPTHVSRSHPLILSGRATGLDALEAFTVEDFAWDRTCHGSILPRLPSGYSAVFGRATDLCMIARDTTVPACTRSSDCDDGNACTTERCSRGYCDVRPSPSGGHCGAPASLCEEQDTCDGIGGCSDAGYMSRGTSCAGGVCDGGRMCVECLRDLHCGVSQHCAADRSCAYPDSDGDGITDEVDADDDNDGIPDADELGGLDLSADSDGDGIQDYLDASVTGCADADGDDVCDLLSMDVDFDGDGIPNHLDRDSDGDGITDTTEGGGRDADGDGLVDDFRDEDMDGLSDALLMRPLPLPNSDMTGGPDFLDTDSDDDGIPDSVEAHDSDYDGVPETSPSGSDSDMDGIDDAFDPDCEMPGDCPGDVIGVPAPTPDLDGDTIPNYRDADDDGDGRYTAAEIMDADDYRGSAEIPADIDADGKPNWYDDDADGDTAPDATETAGTGDEDRDGTLDYLDPEYRPGDSDADGIADHTECPVPARCPDADGDGTPDVMDYDDDGDGILTADETDGDPDNDGVPNHLDLDADGDGIPDLWENSGGSHDLDRDGRVDMPVDGDMDGVDAAFDADDLDDSIAATRMDPRNSDDTGNPDFLDLDADADGVLDIHEADGSLHDLNGDGQVDGIADIDLDGLPDLVDPDQGGTPHRLPDTDEDSSPDFQDLDSDGDTVPDSIEAHDFDADGRSDNPAMGPDSDADGIDDAYDHDVGGLRASEPDHDRDGILDWRDSDDDGDGLLTMYEDVDGDGDPTNDDTDADGAPNYLDADDDGDDIDTIAEGADPNGDGNPDDAVDADANGVPDFRESLDLGHPIDGDLESMTGCSCSLERREDPNPWAGLFAVLFGTLLLVRRGRR